MRRRRIRAKASKASVTQDKVACSNLPQTLRILGVGAFLAPGFLALTIVFVAAMAVIYLQTSLLWSLAVMIGCLAAIAFWVASRDGFCELHSDKVIFRRLFGISEYPIKGMKIIVGTNAAFLMKDPVWSWPETGRATRLPLPQRSAGTCPRAYMFLRNLQERGAVVSATGFVPWKDPQPTPFRIDCFRNVRLAGLLLPIYAALLAVDIVLHRLGVTAFNISTLALCPVLVLLARSDVSQLLLKTPEINWSQDEVTLTKGNANLWAIPRKEIKAIILERRALVAGIELSRLCLVTHYSRTIPLTQWSPVMGEELNLIGLAMGWGLEIRVEGESGFFAKSVSQSSAQDTSRLDADADADADADEEQETLPQTFM